MEKKLLTILVSLIHTLIVLVDYLMHFTLKQFPPALHIMYASLITLDVYSIRP